MPFRLVCLLAFLGARTVAAATGWQVTVQVTGGLDGKPGVCDPSVPLANFTGPGGGTVRVPSFTGIDDLVFINATQTLQHKTLVSPVFAYFSTSVSSPILSVPVVTKTQAVVLTDVAQTLTSKTLVSPIFANFSTSVSAPVLTVPEVTEAQVVVLTLANQTLHTKTAVNLVATGVLTVERISGRRPGGQSAATGLDFAFGSGWTLTTGAVVTTKGHDAGGLITIVTGLVVPSANNPILVVTFDAPYATAPYVTISPASSAAANKNTMQQVWISSTSTSFTLNAGTQPLAASSTFAWMYTVIG